MHIFSLFYVQIKASTGGEPMGLQDELYVVREDCFHSVPLRVCKSQHPTVQGSSSSYPQNLLQLSSYLTRDGTTSRHNCPVVIPSLLLSPSFFPPKTNCFHTATNLSKQTRDYYYHCSSLIFSNESFKKKKERK